MSESFGITVKTRQDGGKGASRRLRRTGLVPGVLYGGHKEPVMISVPHHELLQRLESEAFYSHILDLALDGNSEKVVLKDLQRHPAKPFVTHVDFQRVSMDEKIRMNVPLHFINEDTCPGVKLGGTASHNINELEVSCLPKDLPEFIEVDMSGVEMGQSIHVNEIVIPEGVELSHTLDPHAPVVSVHGLRAEEEDEVEGEGEGEGGVESPGEV